MGRYREEPHRWYFTEINSKALNYCLLKQTDPTFVFDPVYEMEMKEYLKRHGGALSTKTAAMAYEANSMKTLKQVRVYTGGEE